MEDYMFKTITFICCLLFPLLVVAGETIQSPVVKPGDSWVFVTTTEKGQNGWTQKHEEFKVIHASANSILQAIKENGSNQPPKEQLVGKDWSRFRNINGKETIVNRPLYFPLKEGKSWETDYSEDHPNKEHKNEHFHTSYTVIGWEDIDVPAGHFKAIKIEAEGQWKAELESSVNVVSGAQVRQSGSTIVMQSQKIPQQSGTGRLYKAFWYVPQVKRYVKSIEEYYNAGGFRNERYTSELESYNVSQ
jgi:hypothetical protein